MQVDPIRNDVAIDLRLLSEDTRAVLRWVARRECAMDDRARRRQSRFNPLIGADNDLLLRVTRRIGRMRFRLGPEEAECLRLIIDAVQDRFGIENLRAVRALMSGDDDEMWETPYRHLPRNQGSDRVRQDAELQRLLAVLDSDWAQRASAQPSPREEERAS